MVGPVGGKEEPPLSSFSISSSPSQVLSWELLPQREGHVEGSQAREQDPELCSRDLGAHCCGVSWGQCWRQRPDLQPSRLAGPRQPPSFFSFLCSFWPGAQLLPILRSPSHPTTPLLCRSPINVGFLGAPPTREHTEKLTGAENALERRDSRN